MSRPAVARVDLSALRRNYLLARQLHGGQMLAVVKANAYGHGALPCAQALNDIADGFGVASLEEALRLREYAIARPILLMEGIFEASELHAAAQHNLWCVVHAPWQVDALCAADLPRPVHVWLKLDTGMHRLGFSAADLPAMHARLAASSNVEAITLISHFARADEPGCPANDAQLNQFSRMQASLGQARIDSISLANSAAIQTLPTSHAQWGRAGIVMYGVSPFEHDDAAAQAPDWHPVMTLSSKIIAVRELAAGEAIGYGGRFTTTRPTRVGVVACGYADGYPRIAASGTPVLVAGQRSQLIGRVSMDMLTVDLTDIPQAGVGSEVELWGRHISVNSVAASAGTIGYELLCNVKRACFEYH